MERSPAQGRLQVMSCRQEGGEQEGRRSHAHQDTKDTWEGNQAAHSGGLVLCSHSTCS
jgi:hypothetical protein